MISRETRSWCGTGGGGEDILSGRLSPASSPHPFSFPLLFSWKVSKGIIRKVSHLSHSSPQFKMKCEGTRGGLDLVSVSMHTEK